jgi:hypothetical protein
MVDLEQQVRVVPKIVAELRGEYDSGYEATVLRAALYLYKVPNEARWVTDHLRAQGWQVYSSRSTGVDILHFWPR